MYCSTSRDIPSAVLGPVAVRSQVRTDEREHPVTAARTSKAQRAGTVLVATALATGGSALALGATVGSASSHREAPMIAADPVADNTDTYAFLSPDDGGETTTLIANWFPFQEPGGGPNFYPWATDDEASYTIKVDNDADAVADITYVWEFQNIDVRDDAQYPEGSPDEVPALPADGTFLYNNGPVTSFGDANLLFKQTYTLTEVAEDGTATVLLADAPVAPSHVGDASMPDYQALRDEAVVPLDGEEGTSFVGQAEDSFFLDLRVFDLLYGGDLSEVGYDTLAPYNVNSVALQVPTASLLSDETYDDDDDPATAPVVDPTIGVWSTTDRASVSTLDGSGGKSFEGEFVQVSRLGNPLVNEVVIPAYLKDAFNALAPENDASVEPAVNKVLNPELPYLLNAVYGLPIKETPRTDLFTIFLTGVTGLNRPLSAEAQPSEVLRLNTDIPVTAEPNRLGVLAGDNQGFPNGRRLTDDVVDIALQAVAGAVSVDEDGAPTGVTPVAALAAGDAVDENNVAFSDTFPYLALPNSGSQEQPVDEVAVPGPTTTVPGPTVTVTGAAPPAGTATATTTVRPGAVGPTGTAPRGGIDTGLASTDGGPSAGSLGLMGIAVVALGVAGYAAASRLRRPEGSA